jgi:predicted nucleotide-binding protein (sugar kinase/HSP70/actin superfamily)
MPCLSYLKFPSFTDNACNSLTLDAVANEYIKRTESQRKEIDSDSLFITYQKGVCRPGSKNSVARWIVSLIKWVYQDTKQTFK